MGISPEPASAHDRRTVRWADRLPEVDGPGDDAAELAGDRSTDDPVHAAAGTRTATLAAMTIDRRKKAQIFLTARSSHDLHRASESGRQGTPVRMIASLHNEFEQL
jgi:hypothetical protein